MESFSVGCYTQTFQPKLLMLTTIIGTINLYHFMSLLMALTLSVITRFAETEGKVSLVHIPTQMSTAWKVHIVVRHFQ